MKTFVPSLPFHDETQIGVKMLTLGFFDLVNHILLTAYILIYLFKIIIVFIFATFIQELSDTNERLYTI